MQPGFLDVYDAKCTHDVLSREYMLQTLEAINTRHPNSIDLYFSTRFSVFGIADLFAYSLRFGSPLIDEVDFIRSAEYESCYCAYGSTLFILHAVYLLDCKEVHYDSHIFIEIIRHVSTKPKRFVSKHHIVPRPSKETQIYFTDAKNLMESLTGSNDSPEFQVLSEIVKKLLCRALEWEGYTENAIARVTLSYLASLYFATSEYKI